MEEKKPLNGAGFDAGVQDQSGLTGELKQIKKSVPDTAQNLFDFLSIHVKAIVACCAILVLAAGAYAGIHYWNQRAAAKASEELGVILIEKQDPTLRMEALEDFLKKAPASLHPTAQLELAAAAMAIKQYDKASAAWTALEASKSPDMRVIAGIGHAKCLLLSQKPQDALKLLTALRAKSPAAYSLPIARQIAVAAEQAGDQKTARSAYAELAGKTAGSGKPYFEFKANRLSTKS